MPDVPLFMIPDGGGADAPPCTNQVACQGMNYKYCGRIGDGCGGIMDCGGCPAGQVCGGGARPACAAAARTACPDTCDSPGGRFCGKIGDGCGRHARLRRLPRRPDVCGGAGTPNLCGGGTAARAMTCDSAGRPLLRQDRRRLRPHARLRRLPGAARSAAAPAPPTSARRRRRLHAADLRDRRRPLLRQDRRRLRQDARVRRLPRRQALRRRRHRQRVRARRRLHARSPASRRPASTAA